MGTVAHAVVIDNDDPGFSKTGGWGGSAAGYYWVNDGNAGASASWNFTGLADATYEVHAVWTEQSNRSTAAPYSFSDGLLSTTLNQWGPVAGVVSTNRLGTVAIHDGDFTVTLTDDASTDPSTFVIADAMILKAVSIPQSGGAEQYRLVAYDDCGVPGRQPHVQNPQNLMFSTAQVDAGDKARSVVTNESIAVLYTDLDPALNYGVALTFATATGVPRTVRILAGSEELEATYEVPQGQAGRTYYAVPSSALSGGTLSLTVTNIGGPNAVLSIAELWADTEQGQPAGSIQLGYDDCGVPGMQEHILNAGDYTFPTNQVAADEAARTISFGSPSFQAGYAGLDPDRLLYLGLTYASDSARQQSLRGGGVEIHGAFDLPVGSATNLLFPVPYDAVAGNALDLDFISLAGPNAVCSEVTLWQDKGLAAPIGFDLLHYDDCGAADRAPHVVGAGSYSFNISNVDARINTISHSPGSFSVAYEDLNPAAAYAVAVTYASDAARTQSLHAGGLELHGPRALPVGTYERLVYNVPAGALQGSTLELVFSVSAGPNAVASVVELWTDGAVDGGLQLELYGLTDRVRGRVYDKAYYPVSGAVVNIVNTNTQINLEGETLITADNEGKFEIDPSLLAGTDANDPLAVFAAHLSKDVGLFVPRSYQEVPVLQEDDRQPIDLGGTWRLNPSPPAGFETNPAAPDGAGWSDVAIPGQWLQQGFDVPANTEVGVALGFAIPADWSGKRVVLRFEAVHAGTYYWFNGQYLGYSEAVFTPIEWDVTDYAVVGGDNYLAMRMTENTVSERLAKGSGYAHHSIAGIHRKVSLIPLPPVGLQDLRVATTFENNYADAFLSVAGDLLNTSGGMASNLTAQIVLRDADGNPVAVDTPIHALADLPAGGEAAVDLATAVPGVRLWTAETPNLYTLQLEILRDGALVERLERKVGFREVEVSGSEVLLNGVPIKLRGVNRHEVDSLTGRADTARHADTDARLFKEANINYIRTSHYPPTREFLEACDKYGIYVQVEAPFVWTHVDSESTVLTYAETFLDPTAAMVRFHGNHSSVIMWSLANESHWTDNYEAALELVRVEDPTRPVVFESEQVRDSQVTDIAVRHYPALPWTQESLLPAGDGRPVILGEYFHTEVYNTVSLEINPGPAEAWAAGQNSLDSYMGLIHASDFILGGAIWAGIDETFDLGNGTSNGYGDWGLIDGVRRKKTEWWHSKCFHSPIIVPVRTVDYTNGQSVVSVPVINRYSFTDLDQVTLIRSIDGDDLGVPLSLAPMSSNTFSIAVPPGAYENQLMTLTFTNALDGVITEHGVWLGGFPFNVPSLPGSGLPNFSVTVDRVTVDGNGFKLVLDRDTAVFVPGATHTSLPLASFPVLHYATLEKGFVGIVHRPYEEFPVAGTRVISSVWLIDDEGVGEVSFSYTYTGPDKVTGELGLRLPLLGECQEVEWQRKGEWEIYPADHIGRPAGIANAHRGAEWNGFPTHSWPWSLDENEYGTRDFRASKYNVYRTELRNDAGQGVLLEANADANARPQLSGGETWFHLLEHNAPATITSGTVLSGSFSASLLTVADPYTTWAQGYGLTGTAAAATYDVEPDGMDNLAEYALGGNPTNDDTAAFMPSFEIMDAGGGSNSMNYIYNRRFDSAILGLTYGLTYGLNVSTNLLSEWIYVSNAYETGTANIDLYFESVTNTVPTTEDEGFISLEIRRD